MDTKTLIRGINFIAFFINLAIAIQSGNLHYISGWIIAIIFYIAYLKSKKPEKSIPTELENNKNQKSMSL